MDTIRKNTGLRSNETNNKGGFMKYLVAILAILSVNAYGYSTQYEGEGTSDTITSFGGSEVLKRELAKICNMNGVDAWACKRYKRQLKLTSHRRFYEKMCRKYAPSSVDCDTSNIEHGFTKGFSTAALGVAVTEGGLCIIGFKPYSWTHIGRPQRMLLYFREMAKCHLGYRNISGRTHIMNVERVHPILWHNKQSRKALLTDLFNK